MSTAAQVRSRSFPGREAGGWVGRNGQGPRHLKLPREGPGHAHLPCDSAALPWLGDREVKALDAQ